MNKKSILVASVMSFMLTTTSAFADSVYSRSAREMLAVLSNPMVMHRLSENGNQPIVSISRSGNQFQLATPNCALSVILTYISVPTYPGSNAPVKMELNVGYPTCGPGGISVGNH